MEQRVTASTSNQALGALLFLYRHVLDRDLGRLEDMPRGRLPERLPVVLTRDEVRRLLAELHGRSARAKGLSPRHARLAVGAVATLVQFLFDTHGERKHS